MAQTIELMEEDCDFVQKIVDNFPLISDGEYIQLSNLLQEISEQITHNVSDQHLERRARDLDSFIVDAVKNTKELNND